MVTVAPLLQDLQTAREREEIGQVQARSLLRLVRLGQPGRTAGKFEPDPQTERERESAGRKQEDDALPD